MRSFTSQTDYKRCADSSTRTRSSRNGPMTRRTRPSCAFLNPFSEKHTQMLFGSRIRSLNASHRAQFTLPAGVWRLIEEPSTVRHNIPAVRIFLRLLIVQAFFAGIIGLASPVHAGSLGDWFKKVGGSFAHPQKHPTPSRNRSGKGKAGEAATPTPTPSPVASPEPTVRTASIVNEGRKINRDMPYGIPVAGKPGFVTSPYSPTQGMVDVRGIPSGTEVKDPYSGKLFLTP